MKLAAFCFVSGVLYICPSLIKIYYMALNSCGCNRHHDHHEHHEGHHHFGGHHHAEEVCFGDNDACLVKKNYLSEFKTDLEKELARKNIGLSDSNIRKICTGVSEELESIPVVNAAVSSSAPTEAANGDVYYDTEKGRFYAYDSSTDNWNAVQGTPDICHIQSGTDLYLLDGGVLTLIGGELKSTNGLLVITKDNMGEYIEEVSSSNKTWKLKLSDKYDKYFFEEGVFEGSRFLCYYVPEDGSEEYVNGKKITIAGYYKVGDDIGEYSVKNASYAAFIDANIKDYNSDSDHDGVGYTMMLYNKNWWFV